MNLLIFGKLFFLLTNEHRFFSFTYGKEPNIISLDEVARQNWCILSIHDKIEKISIFSEVYENKPFGTFEPSEFTIPCGRALKSEKSMFFKPVSLKVIQNLIFKL